MGHIFSNQGLKIDPDKVNAVLKMPRPEDVEGEQRLNGFVNYLAKFLPRLADHMELIRRLTPSSAGQRNKKTPIAKSSD